MKWVMVFLFLLSGMYAKENIRALQYSGVKIDYQGQKIVVEREQHAKCLDIPITPSSLYSDSYAHIKTPDECKKTFMTTLGTLQPLRIDDEIETVGELEVLAHMKKAQKDPSKYILIDTRRSNWYEQMTIPSAINLPYNEIEYDSNFVEDFEKMLKMLHIKKNKKGLDFSAAKEVVLFCNGSWCVQSPRAIDQLIALGYPKKKLKWYRGGVQDWLAYGFTILKNP
ncbi:MAG: rhodanese-like domain-containing protein [Epsilonproteobacteria bacterium]|nr:rhodanese-like domain-containing protein [Campylobacterota bacterium]